MKLKNILGHPLMLVIPWSVVIAEVSYAESKRKKRRRKRLLRDRQLREEASLPQEPVR